MKLNLNKKSPKSKFKISGLKKNKSLYKSFVLPNWQSHRGYWVGGEKENSLAAFKMAKEMGYEIIECDVQLSKDLIPVVYHDETLERLENKKINISELNFNELKQQYNIPSLEEVLKSQERPEKINIELKTSGMKSLKLADQVAKVIDSLGIQKNILFSSFNPFIVAYLNLVLPDIPKAFLLESLRHRAAYFLNFIEFNYLNIKYSEINKELIMRMKKKNIQVVAWTVNDPEEAQRLKKLGVVSIITDQILP